LESYQLASYPALAPLAWLEQSTQHSDLSGKHDIVGEPVRININRKLFGAATVFLGVIGGGAISREISAGSVGVAIIIAIVFGGSFAYYARGFIRPDPAIVINAEGLGGLRVGRTIPWGSISDIYATKRQGTFGVIHQLVLTVRRDDPPPMEDSLGLLTSRVSTETVEFSIDQLVMPWNEIVELMQDRLGRDVPTKRETFLSAIRAK